MLEDLMKETSNACRIRDHHQWGHTVSFWGLYKDCTKYGCVYWEVILGLTIDVVREMNRKALSVGANNALAQ